LAQALQKLEAGTSAVAMEVNPAVSQLFIADPMHALNKKRQRGGIGRYFATHPPISERVERLEQMAMGVR
jgi:heat shock protein HtpX